MANNKEILVLKSALSNLAKNPIIVIPSILLILFSIILSNISEKINYTIGNTSAIILSIWLILFTLVFFLGFSYFYSGLIYSSFISFKRKVNIKDILSGSNTFWIKNFFAIIIIVIFYSIINGLVGLISFVVGKSLGFSLQTATFFFYFLYFLGLVGFIVFLTYTSFFLVKNNSSIYKNIKNSIYFTAKNYIFTIIIMFVFFAITELLKLLNNFVSWNYMLPSDIISYLFLYPLLSLILAKAIEDLK